MLRLVTLIVLVALAPTDLSAAPGAPRNRTSVHDGQFSMKLPKGWREIAPEDLEDLSMWVADATAGRSVEVYQHGYYPPTFEADPWLPHLLVQIRESGRLRYGQFIHLRPIEEIRETTEDTFPNGMPPLIMGVEVERLSFDPKILCLRLEHILNLKFKGPVRVLTAAFLTERGLVALHYVDREARMDQARKRFGRIVRSVSISPEIAYQRRLSDRWPGLPFFAAAAVVAVALTVFLVRRRLKP